MACSPQLEGGAEVGGQYGRHECGLVIHSATTNLTGEWSCVMEEYRCSTCSVHTVQCSLLQKIQFKK